MQLLVKGTRRIIFILCAVSDAKKMCIRDRATTITDNLNSYDWVGTEGTVLRYLRRRCV